jgi:hypothetical protein
LGRRVLSGPHTGSSPDFGLFSALNMDESNSANAALYGKGATGVWGDSVSIGSSSGFGGYFHNDGGGTGWQYGAYASTTTGVDVYGVSSNYNSVQASVGVVGVSDGVGGAGGVFTATYDVGSAGLAANGWTGAVVRAQNASVVSAGDGLEVGGVGNVGTLTSYAVFAPQPVGDTNYSFMGYAHIHGSNITGADYESDVVYDGAAPLALGSVVALDPANVMGGPLGVVPAGADNADAAIGVISYRLTTVQVNMVTKTMIDAQATAVQPGDRAYVTILGRVAMLLPVGVKVGARRGGGCRGERGELWSRGQQAGREGAGLRAGQLQVAGGAGPRAPK